MVNNCLCNVSDRTHAQCEIYYWTRIFFNCTYWLHHSLLTNWKISRKKKPKSILLVKGILAKYVYFILRKAADFNQGVSGGHKK